jgi:hypothetical protein
MPAGLPEAGDTLVQGLDDPDYRHASLVVKGGVEWEKREETGIWLDKLTNGDHHSPCASKTYWGAVRSACD